MACNCRVQYYYSKWNSEFLSVNFNFRPVFDWNVISVLLPITAGMISTTARKLDRELQDEHSFEVSERDDRIITTG